MQLACESLRGFTKILGVSRMVFLIQACFQALLLITQQSVFTVDGVYLCWSCFLTKPKGGCRFVAGIILMTCFLELRWFFIQMRNFSSIASQSTHLDAGLEPLGMDVFYLMGVKQCIALTVGFSWQWDPKSGRGQQRRNPEGQCWSF